MTAPRQSFGRRLAPVTGRPLSREDLQAERDRQIYLSLVEDPARPPQQSGSAASVPNSYRAGILTGAVIGVVSLAGQQQDGGVTGLHLGPFAIDLGASTLPMALGLTLLAGGRAGFMSALVVHGLLRRLRRTRFTDYAITGGLVGLGLTVLLQAIGASDENWLLETALGAASGALYRLFAGAAPAR